MLRAVGESFPSGDPAPVLQILDQYGQERHEGERERVQLAILALSQGDLDELRTLVACAKQDYRDVLYWAEMAKGYRDPFADRFMAALLTPEATPTRLALLKEAVPVAARIAVLWNPADVSHETQMAELEAPARGLTVTLQSIVIRRPNDLDGAFSAMRAGRAEALLILTSVMLQYHWRSVAEAARTSQLPAMAELREFPVAGGLMSYGPSPADRHERAASHIRALVARLKQQRFNDPGKARSAELVINLKAARALGLTVPPSLLRRANQVVE
ncbi:MAG TPA: ABC transporter substrate binding protein [Candidatus Methylomirabilis sp.]|nr:ABC transporter substrate binding protein [Candidatus Methylomirabilis sp.]